MVKEFDFNIRWWNVRNILRSERPRVLRLVTHSRISFCQEEMLQQVRPS
jgi:hypothetical protein